MTELDPGLANERTALAWQRTALSLVIAATVLARLYADRLGGLVTATLLLTVPVSLWVLLESRGRYRHDAGLRRRPRSRGGRAPTALAFATTTLCVAELTVLLAA